MKPAAFTSTLLLLIGSTASAQLTLLPQIGFEQSKTSVEYNNASSFSPLGSLGAFKANMRLDYRFKGGHSPFIGVGTSPAVVALQFTDPAAVMNNYTATAGSQQWRLEGGYQYSSKPIYFNKKAATKTYTVVTEKTETKKTCGGRTYTITKKETAVIQKNNGLNMRLQPSLGMAYVPNVKQDFTTNGTTYQYNAGNWNTAVVSGLGIEFAKGTQRLFTLSTFYTKGIGNMGTQTLNTTLEGKSYTSQFSSSSSSWGMMVGVPINLLKKKAPETLKPAIDKTVPKPQQQQKQQLYRSKCGSYRYSSVRQL